MPDWKYLTPTLLYIGIDPFSQWGQTKWRHLRDCVMLLSVVSIAAVNLEVPFCLTSQWKWSIGKAWAWFVRFALLWLTSSKCEYMSWYWVASDLCKDHVLKACLKSPIQHVLQRTTHARCVSTSTVGHFAFPVYPPFDLPLCSPQIPGTTWLPIPNDLTV